MNIVRAILMAAGFIAVFYTIMVFMPMLFTYISNGSVRP